jgi:hypothetical protein
MANVCGCPAPAIPAAGCPGDTLTQGFKGSTPVTVRTVSTILQTPPGGGRIPETPGGACGCGTRRHANVDMSLMSAPRTTPMGRGTYGHHIGIVITAGSG